MGVRERKAWAGDPGFKQIPVVTGRLTLPEKQNVGQCPSEGSHPDGETQPPDHMQEAEQN